MSLLDIDIDVDLIVVIGDDGLVVDFGVVVAVLVIVVDERDEVFLVEVFDELLGSEEVEESLLVGLLHGAVELAIAHDVVAMEAKLVHLDFILLVNGDVENHVIITVAVGALVDFDLDIIEAFANEIVSYVFFSSFDEERRHLRLLHYCHLVVDILHVAVTETDEIDLAEARTLFKCDLDNDMTILRGVLIVHLDVGEESVVEVTFDGLCYLVARDGDLLPLAEAREVEQELLVHMLDTGNDDVVDDIFACDACIGDFLNFGVGGSGVVLGLCESRERHQDCCSRQKKSFEH